MGPQTQQSRVRDIIDGPSWGDNFGTKHQDTFRYCFTNINGPPLGANHDKHDLIIQDMAKYQIDILGLAEININFNRVGPTNQWKDRFKKLGTNSHCTTNRHSTSQDKQLFGGTAYLTSKSASHKVSSKGEDPLGLGRWTWAVFTGKQGLTTRIISGYRPVRDHSDRAGTVYSQQEKYFTDHGEAWNPKIAFLDDLKTLISEWQEAGDTIILGIDLNDNTWDSEEAQRLESWGLVNAHKSRHPNQAPVATCNKNTRSIPIDGIWCSPGIEIIQAGITGFNPTHLTTNHQMLWVNLTLDSLFGYRPPPLAPIYQTGVALNNPEQIQLLNARFHKARRQHNIPNQIFWLEQRALNNLFDQDDALLFEALLTLDDNLRKKCKKKM
jgi:hypothetical protein